MSLLIEMVSDVVCPWCWLGLRRVQTAIAAVPDLQIDLKFRPYELDPSIPAGGTDYKSYMQSKFSSDDQKSRASQMRTALEGYGEAEGIDFNFERIRRRPNSFNAHRLIHWAQGQGLGADAKETLFDAVFSKGLDIGDHETLVTLASKIGLDPNIISDLLASDADVDIIRSEQNTFRQMGISGVPTFIANRQFAIQGAESVENIVSFLKTAEAQSTAPTAPQA